MALLVALTALDTRGTALLGNVSKLVAAETGPVSAVVMVVVAQTVHALAPLLWLLRSCR